MSPVVDSDELQSYPESYPAYAPYGFTPVPVVPNGARVAIIDSQQFRRDCLINTLNACRPDLILVPLSTITKCVLSESLSFDLILYYSHDETPFQSLTIQKVEVLRLVFKDVPIVVLSDARSMLDDINIRTILNNGSQLVIPTLKTRLSTALAAMGLVKNSRTSIPLDVLPTTEGGQRTELPGLAGPNHLTRRQAGVLLHLRQGKTNKTIAQDLGIKESTVKAHIWNIMRKMGATNRTQAVYKAQQSEPYSTRAAPVG